MSPLCELIVTTPKIGCANNMTLLFVMKVIIYYLVLLSNLKRIFQTIYIIA